MILLRVSMDHVFSWHVIYTSRVIYCVPHVTILPTTIARVTIARVAKHTITMNGRHVGTNVQLTFVIHQQVTYKSLSNSVHNSENYAHNALINSHINYQGNGLIAHVVKIFQYWCLLLLCLAVVYSSCMSINRVETK